MLLFTEQLSSDYRTIDLLQTCWLLLCTTRIQWFLKVSFFSVLNGTFGSPLNICVPKNDYDNFIMNVCTSFSRLWLPSSTFNSSVPVLLSENKYETFFSFPPSYSMLARFKSDEITGTKEVLENEKRCAGNWKCSHWVASVKIGISVPAITHSNYENQQNIWASRYSLLVSIVEFHSL